jgi:branched-chain amino acid transport system ATP-binding protein
VGAVDSTTVFAATGVRKRFGALVVLDDVDFSLASDEAVGIVGPNGAGKTTLLNVLAGALRPNTGSVRFHGADITTRGAAQRCRLGIARAHQVPRPFGGMTVFENTLVAAATGGSERGAPAQARCLEALELCGILALGNRRAETLGLLDRKRLELARALATDPEVLLLDEIGAGLTDEEALDLLETIGELQRRRIAIVWIEHIVHVLVRAVARLVCMDAGRVIADGEPATVLEDAAVIDAYLGREAT